MEGHMIEQILLHLENNKDIVIDLNDANYVRHTSDQLAKLKHTRYIAIPKSLRYSRLITYCLLNKHERLKFVLSLMNGIHGVTLDFPGNIKDYNNTVKFKLSDNNNKEYLNIDELCTLISMTCIHREYKYGCNIYDCGNIILSVYKFDEITLSIKTSNTKENN